MTTIIPVLRRNTDCAKYDAWAEYGIPADALPMWVADMDFKAPEAVLDALRARVDHGAFGYPAVQPDYAASVTRWFRERFHWNAEPGWLVRTPGVVFGLSMAVRAFTNPGDAVVIQPPVYRPFFDVIAGNGRRVVENPLRLRDDRYGMDFDHLEGVVRQSDARLLILCSPHNPVGRVWTREELRALGDICRRHDVIVASDEIHCDFTWPDHPHTPFLKAVPELRDAAIVCTAPSKTFTLAGLQASNLFIPGEDLRRRFQRELDACGMHELNNLGLTACQAAYDHGGPWLDALKDILRGNAEYMGDFIRRELPQLRFIPPEGTYLAWVDFSALGLSPEALHDVIARKARLWLDDGGIFGAQSAQFQRFVLACPRATVEEAMRRLKNAIG